MTPFRLKMAAPFTQDVDRLRMPPPRGRDGGFDLNLVGDVGGNANCPSAGAIDVAGTIRRVLGPRVNSDDRGAGFGQAFGDAAADVGTFVPTTNAILSFSILMDSRR